MANNTGTLVIDSVRPANPLDTFPVALMDEIKGGLHVVDTMTTIDATLPVERRQLGMWVYCTGDQKTYVLTPNLNTWNEKSFGATYSLATASDHGLLSKEHFTQLFTLTGDLREKLTAKKLVDVNGVLPLTPSVNDFVYFPITNKLKFRGCFI